MTNLTDTIISLETVNPIEFFGVNNGKLDILKKKFPLLKILSFLECNRLLCLSRGRMP